MHAQSINNYPDFSNHDLNELLNNKAWKVLEKAEGFLNKNNQKDVALVLESKDSLLEQRIGEKTRKNLLAARCRIFKMENPMSHLI